jgi:hypothetical protein
MSFLEKRQRPAENSPRILHNYMPFAYFDKLNANGERIFGSVRAEPVEAYERLFC